ncbi:S-layer homology domain-containing protein [Egicoccus halophilus]|uniref:SLH domain-containing protein n=1 Tax=Egicoccus halophilus TaxID=1670830 RepID=A0A8J3EV65_9ACTN|nr:S-layer homology domain-containing protein [Egicoccus halophilus]GGI09048.1 hypothetical protein GCM10011354_32130 [Egicoccus halophilus]
MPTPRRRTLLLVLCLASLAIAVPAAAHHVFSDVPSSSTHHDAISELAGSGITAGCATDPPRFCAGNAVNRGQMAAFLTRGLPRVSADHSTTTLADGSGVPVTVTVEATGDRGGTGYVVLQGSLTVHAEQATACPCEVEAFVFRARDEAQGPSSWSVLTGQAGASGVSSVSLPVTWAVPQASGTTDEYRVAVFVDGAPASARAEASLTAMTSPFGEVPQP